MLATTLPSAGALAALLVAALVVIVARSSC